MNRYDFKNIIYNNVNTIFLGIFSNSKFQVLTFKISYLNIRPVYSTLPLP